MADTLTGLGQAREAQRKARAAFVAAANEGGAGYMAAKAAWDEARARVAEAEAAAVQVVDSEAIRALREDLADVRAQEVEGQSAIDAAQAQLDAGRAHLSDLQATAKALESAIAAEHAAETAPPEAPTSPATPAAIAEAAGGGG